MPEANYKTNMDETVSVANYVQISNALSVIGQRKSPLTVLVYTVGTFKTSPCTYKFINITKWICTND